MSREATKWSYSEAVLSLGLETSELAILRAICWHVDPRIGYCPALPESELEHLTGYTGHQTYTDAREHLRKLGLISYEHENRASDMRHDKYGSSNAYVYYVHCGKRKGA